MTGEAVAGASRVWAFVKLSRPHFLLGGLLLFALGASAAVEIELAPYLLGQLMITSAQITAHYLNEYHDFEPDQAVANRTFFSGGSGVLTGGELGREVALRAGAVSAGLAVAAALAISFVSPWAGLVGLCALLVSWSYSAPPLRLLGTGWGELAASITVGGLVPLAGVLSQGEGPPAWLWWGIAVLVPVHMAMLLAFELPDLETDAAAGKRVLAVRVGRSSTERMIVAFLALAAALAFIGGLPGTVLGIPPALAMPLTARSRRYGLLTASAVATLVLTALGLLATRL